MNPNEFIEKFYENLDNLELFEDTLEFFKNEIPEDIKNNEDISEIILDNFDFFVTTKDFDKLFHLFEIIKAYNQESYLETFPYFDNFKIVYNLSKGVTSSLENDIVNFINNPGNDINYYDSTFLYLIFYQQSDILNIFIEKNFENFINNDDYFITAYNSLINYIVSNSLEQTYLNNIDNLTKNKKYLDIIITELNFKSDVYLDPLLSNLNNEPEPFELFKIDFGENFKIKMTSLNTHFDKYMFNMGFHFYLSDNIWTNLFSHLINVSQHVKDFNTFVTINKNSFKQYLTKFASNFEDGIHSMFAIVWGSQYIYDFLYHIKYIDDKQYQESSKIIQNIKGLVIRHYFPDLWKFKFLHTWAKPNGVNENEYVAESKIFNKTYNFKYGEESNIKDFISEELAEIGEISDYITSDAELFIKQNNFLIDEISNLLNKKNKESRVKKAEPPIIKKNLPGRNEPCICGSGKKYKKCCGK